jgi:hypothetical protein
VSPFEAMQIVGLIIFKKFPVSLGKTAIAPELNIAITNASLCVHTRLEIVRFILQYLLAGGLSSGLTKVAVWKQVAMLFFVQTNIT